MADVVVSEDAAAQPDQGTSQGVVLVAMAVLSEAVRHKHQRPAVQSRERFVFSCMRKLTRMQSNRRGSCTGARFLERDFAPSALGQLRKHTSFLVLLEAECG